MNSLKDNLKKPQTLLVSLVILGLAIAPIWLTPYRQNIAIVSMYYVILAASWNLLSGYTGQFSLAHQTFAGLGGYASGLMIYHLDVSIGVGFIAAVLVTGLVGFLLGMLVLRMRGIYLAVATWAFSESVRLMMTAGYKFTRGEQGLHMPPLFDSLEPTRYYYVFLVLMIVLLLIMYAVVRSPIGSFLRAIKDDELAARAMGIDTVKWKLFIMTFASVIAGIAGFFFAHYILILSPVILSFNEIGKIVIMVVFGGLGTFAGPLIGAPMVVIINEITRDLGAWNMVFYSFIVIVIMRAYRQGLVKLLEKVWARVGKRPSATTT
ncbi:MAG: branched-chain amino acid ABC transporter permease [Chloroflexi bacterium]|nr:branched-chain amino acid ABC transporter permease [Chloroflexota bacterium]